MQKRLKCNVLLLYFLHTKALCSAKALCMNALTPAHPYLTEITLSITLLAQLTFSEPKKHANIVFCPCWRPSVNASLRQKGTPVMVYFSLE